MNIPRILAGLCAAVVCAACSQWDLPVEIPFTATWRGAELNCSDSTPALTDLRFFVTNPRLLDATGQEYDVRFATEYEWENDAVAYIDLETGAGTCAGGSPDVYDHVVGVARAGDYRGLKFTVAVPFRLNHADRRSASPPLDLAEMHWHDVSGYKFLRAGVATPDRDFHIEVGSAKCTGSVGYVTGCEFPNRIEVFLPDFVPGESGVAVNLDELVAGLTVQPDTETSCSTAAVDKSCQAALAALGIDVATGRATGTQRVFSLR